LVGRSTCSDRALGPDKRMNASRNRQARFARLRLVPATLSETFDDKSLCQIIFDKHTALPFNVSFDPILRCCFLISARRLKTLYGWPSPVLRIWRNQTHDSHFQTDCTQFPLGVIRRHLNHLSRARPINRYAFPVFRIV